MSARVLATRALAVARFVLPSMLGFGLGALAGLVYGLAVSTMMAARMTSAARAGPVVLVLLAFPPTITTILGANGGFVLALFAECAVIAARRIELGAPRHVANLAMLVAGVLVAIAFFVFVRREPDELAQLAILVVAGAARVPASFAAGGLAALVTRLARRPARRAAR